MKIFGCSHTIHLDTNKKLNLLVQQVTHQDKVILLAQQLRLQHLEQQAIQEEVQVKIKN